MDLTFDDHVTEICQFVLNCKSAGRRKIVAIAGPPASGKSTMAAAVVQKLCGDHELSAALVPMDGYHLDDSILKMRGLLHRKGAPKTFDADGFCDMVRGLATSKRDVFLPTFDREKEVSIANSLCVCAEAEVIVIEGNYLLLDRDPWAGLDKVVAGTVFLKTPLETLKSRLAKRWSDLGLPDEVARTKIEGNDLVNAVLVLDHSRPADLTLA